MPINPNKDIPPITPNNINPGCIPALSPIIFGLIIFSIVDIINIPNKPIATAPTISPEIYLTITIGIQTKVGPNKGSKAKTKTIKPQNKGASTLKI